MEIKHRPFPEHRGGVQSLALVSDEGIIAMTTGMCLPGEYNFGKAKRKEIIQITMGTIVHNGCRYSVGDELLIIEPGDDINWIITSPTAYLCIFPG